ncbi:MAG: hypothetical protein E6Q43_06625 [Dokdonella sp.]|nr:MAG: hypothetical protein E6Q43_06625 [Dokdonella sp.]
MVLSASSLAACYVVPVTAPDGTTHYGYYPVPPPATAAPGATGATGSAGAPATPASLPVRLYPANEMATKTGVVTGTVANMMTGKGRFVLDYEGEVLNGEATRVSDDERRGVASAYSPRGMYMSCEYQMSTPYKGAGNCSFANGAKYQMHIGQ